MVQVAKDFTESKSYKNSVISSMCYGIQWDAVMQFFDNRYIDGYPDKNSYVVYSNNEWLKHNYANGNPNLLTGIDCGSPAGNKMKNIYDMGGNMKETTMEITTTNNSINPICRGGFIASFTSGHGPSPSLRYYSGGNFSNVDAFRMTLSLKE